MKLVTDDRCRIQSRELFKPNTPYQAEWKPDGRVELVELVKKETSVPEVKMVRTKEGFVMFPPSQRPTREAIRDHKLQDRKRQSGTRE